MGAGGAGRRLNTRPGPLDRAPDRLGEGLEQHWRHIASGLGAARPGSPECDMIETSDKARSGKAAANSWAIMPPIETPTMWAAGLPAASSTAAESRAMSKRS
jgi:hypothetical protein